MGAVAGQAHESCASACLVPADKWQNCSQKARTSHIALMSQICMRGLVGDSSITSAVLPGRMAAATALQEGEREQSRVACEQE